MGQQKASQVRKNNGTPSIQIHDMGTKIADLKDPQILYAVEWDQISPWVTVLKGALTYVDKNGDEQPTVQLAYLGWPMIDKAAFDEANAP